MHIIKGSTFRWSRFRNDVAGGCLMIPALHDRPLREESSSVFSFEGDKITPQQTVKECAAPSVQIKLPRGSRISWETSEEEGHFFFYPSLWLYYYLFTLTFRAKVKHGLKIISTQTTNPAWGLTFDVNGKHIAAAVTAVRNFSVSALNNHQRSYKQNPFFSSLWANNQSSLILSCSSSQELFTWLLAVNVDNHKDSSEIGPDGGVRALWSWTIRSHSTSPAPISSHHHHHGVKEGLDEVKGKLTSRFEVLKDEVQSVFPIIKVILWTVSISLTLLFPARMRVTKVLLAQLIFNTFFSFLWHILYGSIKKHDRQSLCKPTKLFFPTRHEYILFSLVSDSFFNEST